MYLINVSRHEPCLRLQECNMAEPELMLRTRVGTVIENMVAESVVRWPRLATTALSHARGSVDMRGKDPQSSNAFAAVMLRGLRRTSCFCSASNARWLSLHSFRLLGVSLLLRFRSIEE